jgi:hypothetical protein
MKLFFIAPILGVLISFCANAQIITTVAGNGSAGFSGDGGPATVAQLDDPYGVAVDHVGNVYIAENNNNRIRKVSVSGTITTIAGTGLAGYSGDGGAATAARLDHPYAVAIDSSGDIFIADAFNHCVRKINTSGLITTVAGTGTAGYSGDGGPATAAQLRVPFGLVVDSSDNIYIADSHNNCVRKVDVYGTIITIAGTGSLGFSGDGGAATAAQLHNPVGIAIDGRGNVYFAENNNHRVRKVSSSGIINTIAGTGAGGFNSDGGDATATQLYYPWAVAVDSRGNVYISDVNNQRIRRIDSLGIIYTIVGTGLAGYSGDGGAASAAQINYPADLAFDHNGNFYFADHINNRIRKVTYSMLNHAPYFNYTTPPSNSIRLCQDFIAYPITEVLQARDLDTGQTLTWSVAVPPSHGTASVSYSATSTGSIIRPAGVSYTPATGYTGNDSMRITISDGVASSTSTFRIVVNPKPSVPTITGASTVCNGGTTILTASPTGGFFGSMDGNTTTNATTGVVRGIGGGLSTIYYNGPYNSFGCRTQARTTIAVLGIPSAGTLAGAATVCPGASTTLTPSVSGGSWNSSNTARATVNSGTLTGITTGSVNISYTVNNGCASATTMKSMTISGATVPPVIGGIPYVRIGAMLSLTNALSGGVWSSSNLSIATVGSSTGIVTGISAGTDTIIYSYTNSCGIMASVTKLVSVLAHKDDDNKNEGFTGSSIKVYPNPTTSDLIIDHISEPTPYRLLNIAGITLQQGTLDANTNRISLQVYAPGIYLLETTNSYPQKSLTMVVKE